MSQVNFIKSFELFIEFSKRNKLTSYERMFYIALFHCANAMAQQAENYEWPDDYFPVSNSEMAALTGFGERAIRDTKNSLKQKGLLDFKKGNGKKSDPEYRIFYLARNGYKIAPVRPIGCENAPVKTKKSGIDCENAPDSVGDSVGDSVPVRVGIDCENAPGQPYINNIYINNTKYKNINTNTIPSDQIRSGTGMDADQDNDVNVTSNIQFRGNMIRERIDYEDLLAMHPEDQALIDGIVSLIQEITFSGAKEIVIARNTYPTDLVLQRFQKLNCRHILYVMDCFSRNSTKISNVKKYLLTALFNAPATMDAHYRAEVQHDMPELASYQ